MPDPSLTPRQSEALAGVMWEGGSAVLQGAAQLFGQWLEGSSRATVTASAEVTNPYPLMQRNPHRLPSIPTRPAGPEGEWQGGVPGAGGGDSGPTMPPRATVTEPGAEVLEATFGATLTFQITPEWSQEMENEHGARRQEGPGNLYLLGSWETANLPLQQWNQRWKYNQLTINQLGNTPEQRQATVDREARLEAITETNRLEEHERVQSGYYERLERYWTQPVPVEPGWSVSPIIGNGQFGLTVGWGNRPGGVWSPIIQGLYQGMGPGGNLPPDHVQHLLAGLGIAAGAEFTGNLLGMSEGQRNWLGLGLVTAGGFGREFYNETGFNWGDIGATATVPGSFYLNRGLNGRNDSGYPGLSWQNFTLGATAGVIGYGLYNQLEVNEPNNPIDDDGDDGDDDSIGF